MLDWLYEELDPASSARVAAHVGRCAACAAEAGALRRTREVFRGFAEDEPPPSVSAILLHQAARRLPAAAGRAQAATAQVVAGEPTGFWPRFRAWFAPITTHPAAAALASLVLVAGVAGTLYVREGSDMAAPDTALPPASASHRTPVATGSSDDLAPTEPPASPDLAAGDGFEAGLLEAERQAQLRLAQEPSQPRDGIAADPAADPIDGKAALKGSMSPPARVARNRRGDQLGDRSKQDVAPVADREEAAEKPRPESDARSGGDAKLDAATRRGAAPSGTRSLEKDSPTANAVSGADPLVVKGSDARDQSASTAGGAQAAPPLTTTTTPTMPGPATGTAASADDEDAGLSDRASRERPPTADEQRWLASQETRLGTAVKTKRCRDAAAIANDILDRNPDYYTRRVTGSKVVEPCRWYVGDEQKRRATARSEQTRKAAQAQKARKKPAAKPASKTNTGAGKAKAAPQDERAAEPTSR